MKPRVGLIGCGNIGRFHSRSIYGLIKLGLIDAEYVAVCDRDEDRAQQFAQLAHTQRYTTDTNALIDSPDINTVYVCTPTAEHKALVLQAVSLGKHIFCEKPLARTLDEARELHDAVVAAGVRHQIGLILRHAPIESVLKQMIADPGLGRLMSVVMRDDQTFPVMGHYGSTWRGDFSMTGGGTLIEHSIHDLDALTWLCGDVASLRATTRNFSGHEDVEDLAMVTLHFANGATGQLASIWHDITDRNTHRLLELFFERGYFAIEEDFLGPIRYETYASNGKTELSADDVQQRYLELVGLTDERHTDALRRFSFEDLFFLRAIADGRDAYPGFDIALRVHELVDAVYRSAADNGETIAL